MSKRPDLPKLAQDQMTTANLDHQLSTKTQTTAHLEADAAKTGTDTKPAEKPSN